MKPKPKPKKKSYGYNRPERLKISNILSSDDKFLDYKDERVLSFLTDRFKIIPRRHSGISAKQQRYVRKAIKRARNSALVPYCLM